MADWQKVYQSNVEHKVAIVKAILDENYLDPVIVNKKDSSYQIGLYEVHVAPDNVIKALKIIEEEIDFK
ncbi:MAG: hypothetical protein O2887_02130 [Bacteroidetes bacterium]|nr:hypothetical protein [Bacteroidota bacterium]MDA1119289.1 hypothetical protein [Bacteroidota bacterium]